MFGDRMQQTVVLGPFNSDGDETRAIMRAQGAIIIDDVYMFNTAAIATHATNYITFKLVNMGTDSAGTTVIATASTSQTGGSAMVAHVPEAMTITAANKSVADGEIIAYQRDEENTDASAVAGFSIVVSYTHVGAP